MRWPDALHRFTRRWRQSGPDWDVDALRATPPLCIVGDVHGRLDLAERMLNLIATQPGAAQARRIFVGDMIDRGPDSLGVLRRLHALSTEDPAHTICLMGNHERMMLDFLADPDRHGPRWRAAGGDATLASAGIAAWARAPAAQLAGQLREALGPQMLAWLEALPLCWEAPGIGVTHAGAAPEHALAQQSAQRLLWGARGAREGARTDGMWIAQGHDIVPRVQLAQGRIMLDTGAWRSGLLCAIWIDAQGARVLHAGPDGVRVPTA